MPLFDYTCVRCRERFEARVTSARARPKCRKCGSRQVKRAPALAAFRGSSRAAPRLSGPPAPDGCGTIERPFGSRPSGTRSHSPPSR